MSYNVANGASGYRSTGSRALLLGALCLALAIVSVALLHRFLMLMEDPAQAEIRHGIESWKRVEAGLLFCLALALVHYLLGVRANMAPLGVSDSVWPPMLVLILALVPGLNMALVALMLRETWQASDPSRAQSLFVNWRQSSGGGLAFLWLFLMLLSLPLSLGPWLLLGFENVGAERPAGLFGAVPLSLLGALLSMGAAPVLAVLAFRLTRRQDLRAMRPDVGALPAWGR